LHGTATRNYSKSSPFQDSLAVLGEEFMPEDYAESYGTGFDMLQDKAELEGKSLNIIQWGFHESKDHKDETGTPLVFVAMELVTEKTGEKYIVNDGSGIRDQLAKVTASRLARGWTPERAFRGLYVRGGFRLSHYTFTDDKGAESAATSYYLQN
jgi:hypothetical protein